VLKNIDQALKLHQSGQIDEALVIYQQHLALNPNDPLALYGIASIYLSRGQLIGYEFPTQAIFSPQPSTLDRSLAADSIIRLLIQHQYQDHAKRFIEACQSHLIQLPALEELQEAITIPPYLQESVYDEQLQQTLERYRPIESTHYVYAIDIVGGCNLRCPTCPVANSGPMPKGLMSLELYGKILKKIRVESVDSAPDIWLFNWTEPLLHPKVAEFIEMTHAIGMSSFISSNLNMSERIESVIKAQPSRFKISLSSLNQDIYGQTHVRGQIDEVIKNLYQLAKWRDHYRSKTQIWIGHHLYKNTLGEQQAIQTLAHQLGFGYAASPAILAPIEAVMKLMNGQASEDINQIRPQFLYDPLRIKDEMSRKRSGKKDCELRFNMTAIQHDGLVNLCCATTKNLHESGIHFLEHDHQEIEQMKYNNAFCKQCMKSNLHLTMADC